jgi:hypothetical protein
MTTAEQALTVMQPAIQQGEGGSTPTARLLKREWEVAVCRLELARALTKRFHSSAGGSNTRVLVCGLWRRGEWLDRDCAGASWWLPPTKTAGGSVCPENPQGVLALSRLVVIPEAPKNACSFLIRHSMRFIDRARWPVLLTYADEWRGHEGTIYKALEDAGWKFDGYSKPEATYVDADGRMMSRKRGPRTFTHSEMLALGFECKGKFRRKRFVHRIDDKPKSRRRV